MESDGVHMVPQWMITVFPLVLIQFVVWPLLYYCVSIEYLVLCIVGAIVVYFAYGHFYALTIEDLHKRPVVVTGLCGGEESNNSTHITYRLRSRIRQNARAEISEKRRADLCGML